MVNADRVDQWAEDIAASVVLYNAWFRMFAPPAYLKARRETEQLVRNTLAATENLCNIRPETLARNPCSISILRTLTMPPLARERLAGLSGVPLTFLGTMDKKGMLPPRMKADTALGHLGKVATTIQELIDTEIFPWVRAGR